jgi:hypothetical protein
MLDYDRLKVAHSQRVPLHVGLMFEFRGHDHSGRAPQRLKPDSIVRTARCAGASIADGRQDDVVLGSDPVNECRIRVF